MDYDTSGGKQGSVVSTYTVAMHILVFTQLFGRGIYIDYRGVHIATLF
jgi:hypothetical protein